jgi:hypothetical protein
MSTSMVLPAGLGDGDTAPEGAGLGHGLGAALIGLKERPWGRSPPQCQGLQILSSGGG